MTDISNDTAKKPSTLKKFLPLIVIALGFGVAYFMGWTKYLNPQLLVENADYLQNLVSNNFLLVLIGFIALYAILTVFMLPASILTVASGFLFGIYVGAPAVIIGATIGACALFLAAKTSLQDTLKGVAGPFVAKMEKEYNESPFSYLFTLRLIPVFPFAVANIAPALLGAKFRDYLITTAFGIMPGTIAYSLIGDGLRKTLQDAGANSKDVNVADLMGATFVNMLPAFGMLVAVALIPIAYKKFIKKTPQVQSALDA
jgi:uncharacterized membrane protein YdjX (TVP38/TMEM64 family)